MTQAVHVILGAGQAGGHAAMAMREAGFTGRILLLGAEQHAPYERPPLSKAALTDEPAPPAAWFYPPGRYAERDIDFRSGCVATGLDAAAHRLTLRDGTHVAYDRLLLATGGRARRLTIPGAERALSLRTLEDAAAIRARLVAGARVVCIGAGVIGLEIAASAHARGCQVTVIEAGPGAMGRSLPPAFARYVEGLHEKAGVRLCFGTAPQAIERGRVVCANEVFPADCVIAGIGMERATDLAVAAGLAVEGGIAVDAFGRSSAADIFAAGDVAAFWHPRLQRRLRMESWRHAQNHGIAVGRVMAGGSEAYDDVPWFWTDQHGMNLQVAGLVEEGQRLVLRGIWGSASFAAFLLDAGGAVGAAIGVNAPREVRAAMALIRSGRMVDPDRLADVTSSVQRLAAG
ncbi:MAG: FAD-dependent oxidoreductase [Rhodospirillales bacterium]|nr:FAD-dependent oxidoreductase [Rhodospirillales bacterium]MDE2575707.1 FAD-dependent oxidoreductase [Rhodospirillales bacterium]